jgi:hypothetical protein
MWRCIFNAEKGLKFIYTAIACRHFLEVTRLTVVTLHDDTNELVVDRNHEWRARVLHFPDH